MFIVSERAWVSSVAKAQLGPLLGAYKSATKTWATLHSLLEALLANRSHSVSDFILAGGLKALAFFGLLAKSCPPLLVATVVYRGLPHSVVQKCLQPSLSLHQPHRKVSGSSLFRQILIEYNLTVAVIAHRLGFILLDSSQLQVLPPVRGGN